MKQAEFESLLFVDVAERAAAEPTPDEGVPKYQGRPWTRMRDEMVATGSKTVAELPAREIALFYRSTNSVDGSVLKAVKSLFGGR